MNGKEVLLRQRSAIFAIAAVAGSRGHFRYGVERAKRCVNVHLHCIVSNMERISKMSSLPTPWKNFCGRPC